MFADKENFYTLSLDCRTLLNIWKQSWLSLAGKIQVFKSLVASKPVYLATMIDLQQFFCDTIKSLHKEFIWSSKRPKIKHSTLIADYREGRLKDIDIDAKFRSLKFMWIKRLNDSNFHPWKAVASYLLSSVGGDTIFHQNLFLSDTFKHKVNKLPQFCNCTYYSMGKIFKM